MGDYCGREREAAGPRVRESQVALAATLGKWSGYWILDSCNTVKNSKVCLGIWGRHVALVLLYTLIRFHIGCRPCVLLQLFLRAYHIIQISSLYSQGISKGPHVYILTAPYFWEAEEGGISLFRDKKTEAQRG